MTSIEYGSVVFWVVVDISEANCFAEGRRWNSTFLGLLVFCIEESRSLKVRFKQFLLLDFLIFLYFRRSNRFLNRFFLVRNNGSFISGSFGRFHFWPLFDLRIRRVIVLLTVIVITLILFFRLIVLTNSHQIIVRFFVGFSHGLYGRHLLH